MRDMKSSLEKLLAAAAECDLIEKLATDQSKRAIYHRMAAQYRAMANDLQGEIAKVEGKRP